MASGSRYPGQSISNCARQRPQAEMIERIESRGGVKEWGSLPVLTDSMKW